MDGIGKTQSAVETHRETKAEAPISRLSKFHLWRAGYRALEVIAARDNDHLLRDAGLSREDARDSLHPWRIVGLLLLPRSGRE